MQTQELISQSGACGPARRLTLREAQALAPGLLQSAQACYDEWDESDVDTYAGGGICHLIADALVEILQAAGIDAQTTSSSFEQHVYVICQLAEGVYSLDIPYRLYEVGSMFTWSKISDVTFDASSLDWFRIDADPDRFEEYLEH